MRKYTELMFALSVEAQKAFTIGAARRASTSPSVHDRVALIVPDEVAGTAIDLAGA